MPTQAELIELDRRVMTQAMALADETVTRALPDLSTLGQQEAGGIIRTLATGTIENVGTFATQAAVDMYNRLRELGVTSALAERMVNAGTAESFIAQAIKVPTETLVEPVVGRAMQQYSQGKFLEAQTFLGQAVARAIGNVYRQTHVNNSERDPRATGYQRIASANACSFCLVVSLNKYTTFEASGGYHDNCSCTAVPIFKGQEAFRPDYYDEFQTIYEQGRASSPSDKATDIFASIRANTGRS